MMTEFISRRLLALPVTGNPIHIRIPGYGALKVAAIRLANSTYTRVWDDHSTIHLTGDVEVRRAALAFLDGAG